MTLEDYKSWQQALEGYAGEAQFLLYDDLNHLFAEVKDNKRRGTIAEYLTEQHVSEQVINDIASWMTKELS